MPTNIQNLYPTKREKPNVSSPNIRKSNSYDVEYKITKLKHNSAESFDPLIITFDSNETINSFRIGYKINAANVPKPVSGSLHVILDKQPEKSDDK